MKTQMFILILSATVVICNVQADLIWDSGDHIFSEGYESEIFMYNDATADIAGGGIGALLCYDTTTANIFEGSSISLIKPFDESLVNIYGGEINDVFAVGSSDTNMHAGSINFLGASDLSIINMYVESYDWNPTGGQWGDGLLTGSWLQNSQPFSIQIIDVTTINHINFIPEPTSIIVFGLGAMMLKGIVNA